MAKTLYRDNKNFIIYEVALVELRIILIYFLHKAQFDSLKSTKILAKYFNLSDIFSSDSVLKLVKHTRNNNHFIDLLEDMQLLYRLIYRLQLAKLKMLKTYIEANLSGNLNKSSKFSLVALILFVQKNHGSFHSYVDYQRLINFTIKNYYLLSWIAELLDCLSHASIFSS